MPRNMSFSLTTNQVKASIKTVTRRLGWDSLRPGDLVNACEKAMGLRRGETVNKLALIRVVAARREPLAAITRPDVRWEGFPEMTPGEFIAMFCAHNRCTLDTQVNRIEFEYVRRYTDVVWTCPACGNLAATNLIAMATQPGILLGGDALTVEMLACESFACRHCEERLTLYGVGITAAQLQPLVEALQYRAAYIDRFRRSMPRRPWRWLPDSKSFSTLVRPAPARCNRAQPSRRSSR